MAIQKFIIGLGNPEDKFRGTRHNIGFEILDALIYRLHKDRLAEQVSENTNKKLKSKIVSIQSQKLGEFILLYPQTYMNLSGQAVRALIDWYKIDDLKKLLVIHDDVALPLGKMKWVANGGAGGQHGIESIIEHLGGNKEFTRLKFGIGPDPGGDRRSNYVLSKFPAEHNDLLEKSIKASVDGVMLFLQNASLNKIMDTYNGMDLNPNTQKNTQPKELSQKAGSQEFPTKEKIEKSSNAQP